MWEEAVSIEALVSQGQLKHPNNGQSIVVFKQVAHRDMYTTAELNPGFGGRIQLLGKL